MLFIVLSKLRYEYVGGGYGLLVMLFIVLSKLFISTMCLNMCLLVMLFIVLSKQRRLDNLFKLVC